MSDRAWAYENYIVPALFAPWSARLISSVNPQLDERILDVACGTGIVARRIAPSIGSTGRVVGLDLHPNVLDVARGVARREGLALEWCRGEAGQLPIQANSFDAVVCQFGLMFFPDRHTALMEMKRVLRPGGRVVLSVWQDLARHSFHQALHEVSQRRIGISVVGAVFSLGDSLELRRLLTNSGFQGVEIEPMSITARFPNPEEFLAWEMGVDPTEIPMLQHLDPQEQQAILTALRQDMETPLQEVMLGDEAVVTYHAYIAQATN